MTTLSPTCVFYDGACPLCSREVRHYKKLLLNNKETQTDIDWIDISESRVELESECIKYEDAMRLMHVKDDSGIHQVGLEAVLTLWDRLPYYRRFAQVIRRIPGIHPLLSNIYELTAKHRMKIPGRTK